MVVWLPSMTYLPNWILGIECHHPNWRTRIFFRGVAQPPTSLIMMVKAANMLMMMMMMMTMILFLLLVLLSTIIFSITISIVAIILILLIVIIVIIIDDDSYITPFVFNIHLEATWRARHESQLPCMIIIICVRFNIPSTTFIAQEVPRLGEHAMNHNCRVRFLASDAEQLPAEPRWEIVPF